MTCARSQGYLAKRKLSAAVTVDARRAPIGLAEARSLLAQVDAIVSCKGKRVERLDLTAGAPDPATLARLLLGPTGRLRAPTLRVGRTLLVGFDEATYRTLVG